MKSTAVVITLQEKWLSITDTTTRASFISPFVPLFPAQQNLELVSQSRRTLESSQLSPLVSSPYWSAIYPILCSVDEGRSTVKEKSVNHPFKEYKL